MTKRGWVFVAIAAFVAAMYEAVFMPFLPSPWHEIRPIIHIAVLLVVLNHPRAALVYAGVTGLLLDIFRVDVGTFSIGRLIAVTLLLIVLAETVLTNRSIYATAVLVLLARCADRIWIWIVHAIGSAVFQLDIRIEPLRSVLITMGWDIALISLAFLVLAIFTRRFLVTISRGSRRYG